MLPTRAVFIAAIAATIGVLSLWALGAGDAPADPETAMNETGRRYVLLVLQVGLHDADYVDAYYGPSEWKREATAVAPTLEEIGERAAALAVDLAAISVESAPELVRLRHRFQTRQLGALRARLGMLGGERLAFEEESRTLYDAVAPRHGEADFRAVLDELAGLVPGEGSLAERVEAFRSRFYIPRERLDAVFQAAIAEARARTARWLALPAGESFHLEYVTGKPWSGYNWYQGNFQSLIQVNTDLPVGIDRDLDLACHEGYPGHHVYNALLEQHLVRERGWLEFSVYPLFSPMSLIAEGSANYGIEVAFPGEERLAFE
ncbi:MAG: hypothetical protein ACRD0X_01240, partial [Thermoanaerobaculia bacterium]